MAAVAAGVLPRIVRTGRHWVDYLEGKRAESWSSDAGAR
ncbi:hypothetical protein AS9A_2435 [Hoyosella subflava DQS3-9A1]|uniref:Uncharacterized protein n=1 Tax=Hoyosella subflava (strain DSM 45089 / JCM 17490 / NBRC 109087 / DQS3-9A1) TaxID=443218 RepID=F6EET2_HOYSD|nr:hypothetical protein AS9A_2435 [Hoyosella subflava DQS3-9A1]